MESTVGRLRDLSDISRFEVEMPFSARMPAETVYDLLLASALRHPARRALTMIMTGEPSEAAAGVTYAELLCGVTAAANLFAALGGTGVGVATMLPALIETHYALWGAETAGYALPVNFLMQPEQIAELLRAAGTRILVAHGPHPLMDIWEKALRVRELVPGTILLRVGGHAADAESVDFTQSLAGQPGDHLAFELPQGGDAVAAYFHTGGTTGAPKLVTQTHRNQVSASFGAASLLAYGETDVITNGLPLFHVAGAIACGLACFMAGAEVLILSPAGMRNPAMVRNYWRIVERHRATIIGAVPTSLAALCEVPVDGDLSSVRLAITGAASTPRAVAERFEAHTGKPLHEVLGMTETSGIIAIDPAAGQRTLGSVGYRLPYTQIRVRRLDPTGALGEDCEPEEVGVLTLRGPHVSPGYRHQATDGAGHSDGWLDTGDLVYQDRAGKLFVAGRSKDLIIRGGHNIDPAMIEQAFSTHPAVAMAAAVGQPDAYAGELPVCYVVLRPGASANADELRRFAEPKIAERAAWPKQVHVVEELPLTSVGKIYKPQLRMDATRRLVDQAVAAATGRPPRAIEVQLGGKRGMRVSVTLADPAAVDAARQALSAFLFESEVAAG